MSNLSEVWRENIELLGVSINIYMEIVRYYNRGNIRSPGKILTQNSPTDITEEWEKVIMESNSKSNGMMISSEIIHIHSKYKSCAFQIQKLYRMDRE